MENNILNRRKIIMPKNPPKQNYEYFLKRTRKTCQKMPHALNKTNYAQPKTMTIHLKNIPKPPYKHRNITVRSR